jgi:putative flippase GtrA
VIRDFLLSRGTGQLARFLSVGVANTVVGLGTIWALIGWGGWADGPANLAGYMVGLVCSFVLNRRWTFAHEGSWWPALCRFVLVFAVAYAANLVAFFALRDGFSVNPYLAHALATVPYTLLFFIGSRLFAFRSPNLAAGGSNLPSVRP